MCIATEDRSGRPNLYRQAYIRHIRPAARQGSEFPAVVIPLATQHYMLLHRNLIYTGITRGKQLLVLIGQKKALGIAVRNDRPQRRYSGLLTSLRSDKREALG